mmetsp:Transcript_19238/g.40574  ORF Transcript_19238/g.40574 Transcript_19238/m.40574 type:complete len:227 (+) Transcript_19238:94-774(+)|eukprot:CAMPEP_0183722840 /NCGR_PEP_ID=MMETSP0737-20130205/14678_1 /TAXON_ID=385413 /ORGANISM="Thalassiosira miniscula, Strain CCMP1093" /LENGTH=226 /DNA_ID=CAMNT_0025953079 /DNA_START=19 /DNA_END=699 /DNA_ORIENTATION=+
MMKLALLATLAGSAAAFAPTTPASSTAASSSSSTARDLFAKNWQDSFTINNLPGALPPMGVWDPLGFADKAGEKTLKRYREAEITHGRVAMLAVVGFLVGEAVEGSSFLFDAQISGPAITHPGQIPDGWDALIITFIGAAEAQRAQIGWVDPADVPVDQPGLLRDRYYPGDIGFDPLGLKPTDSEELNIMITKELQNGRLAMIAASGFLVQEAVDGKGILEHLQSM